MSRVHALVMLALAASFFFWIASALPALAQTPATAPTPIEAPSATPTSTLSPDPSSSVFGLLPDPRQWAADVFNQVLVSLLSSVADALHQLVGGVLSSSLNFITQTPPAGTYASPTVLTLWGVVRDIADGALVLVTVWGGFNVIVRDQLGSPYHEAMELVPRLVVGALLVNTSLSWGRLAVDANNALCQAIGQTGLPAWEHANAATQALVNVLSVVIYLVTSLLLLLQMLMRLALVDVLLVASPLALLCWVLPQTQGWARQWSSLFFGAVFTQFLQVLALKLGGSLLTELTPMAPDAALLAVFLGVAVLVLTLRIPGLLRQHAGDGFGFARYLVFRQAARAIGGGGAAKGGA
ncbi:MAG TPA: conjugal transfer protein TrbL family protein [Candidatus Dormibacteraeota bacterium]|nr:conjugal transfer protein TrbL family protein [Candidatus Dormibacteraeota bacterium]